MKVEGTCTTRVGTRKENFARLFMEEDPARIIPSIARTKNFAVERVHVVSNAGNVRIQEMEYVVFGKKQKATDRVTLEFPEGWTEEITDPEGKSAPLKTINRLHEVQGGTEWITNYTTQVGALFSLLFGRMVKRRMSQTMQEIQGAWKAWLECSYQ